MIFTICTLTSDIQGKLLSLFESRYHMYLRSGLLCNDRNWLWKLALWKKTIFVIMHLSQNLQSLFCLKWYKHQEWVNFIFLYDHMVVQLRTCATNHSSVFFFMRELHSCVLISEYRKNQCSNVGACSENVASFSLSIVLLHNTLNALRLSIYILVSFPSRPHPYFLPYPIHIGMRCGELVADVFKLMSI